MSTFVKRRVFRSTVGCCICRSKASNARFIDSARYEEQFLSCFKLAEDRVGEICNACVLLVKRWQKFPRGSERHWARAVDARAGPHGGRSTSRLVSSSNRGLSNAIAFKYKAKYVIERLEDRYPTISQITQTHSTRPTSTLRRMD